MRFINSLAIAVALVATAASAAPVMESKETLPATFDEGHLAKRAFKNPGLNSPGARYYDALPKKAETMEKRLIFRGLGDLRFKGHPEKAEPAENTRGNRYENPSDREGHPDIQISRRAYHGPGSAACIDKSRGCYSED
jgi:hypothetical protein